MSLDVVAERFRWLAFLLVLLFVTATGCSQPAADLTLPSNQDPTTTAETLSTTTPPEVSTTATSAAATSDVADDDYTPITVAFDPDDPPGQGDLEDLVFAAIEADFENTMWCWEHADICDLDRHVGPGETESRLRTIRTQFAESFPDNLGKYRRASTDALHQIEVAAFADQEFGTADEDHRLIGSAVTCESFSGSYLYPDQTVEIDSGQIIEYRVWQDSSGQIHVANSSVEESGKAAVCDTAAGN